MPGIDCSGQLCPGGVEAETSLKRSGKGFLSLSLSLTFMFFLSGQVGRVNLYRLTSFCAWGVAPLSLICLQSCRWPVLTVSPLGVGGTSGEAGVDGFPRGCLQFRIGPVDVDREPVFQVLQPQLHGVLGFQML